MAFRRLLERESGAYWTFLVQLGDRVLVGATPERHISVADGGAVMNPISGTYRYPPVPPRHGKTRYGTRRPASTRTEVRRPGRRHNDLTGVIDEGVQRVAELGLDGAALQELHVVDDEHIDGAQPFLECDRGLRLQ